MIEYTNPVFVSSVASEVDCTDWFKFAKKTPGQPGVFEVDSVPLNDQGAVARRFAFFNGVSFGPAANNPIDAYAFRFGPTTYVSVFRGLTEEV